MNPLSNRNLAATKALGPNRPLAPLARLLLAALLVSGAPVGAADFAAAFLESGMGPRSLGMGGAFVAAADDASATYWNPAGLAANKGMGFLASLHPRSLDRRLTSLSFAYNARGDLAFGLAWQHAGVGDLVGRSVNGTITGNIDDSQNAFYVAVALTPSERLHLGATLKILDHDIDLPGGRTASASGRGLDLGARFHLGPHTTIGLVLRNLAAELKWTVERAAQQSTASNDNLALDFGLGLTHTLGPLLIAAAIHNSSVETYLSTGVEWEASPMLTLRAGLNRLDQDQLGATAAGLGLRPMRNQNLQFHFTYATEELGGSRFLSGLALKF